MRIQIFTDERFSDGKAITTLTAQEQANNWLANYKGKHIVDIKFSTCNDMQSNILACSIMIIYE